jgi:hypothetical protein
MTTRDFKVRPTVNGSPIGVLWQGVYNPAVAYKKGDGVSYNGGSYIAKVDLAAGTTPIVGDNWDQLSAGYTGPKITSGAGAPATPATGDIHIGTL